MDLSITGSNVVVKNDYNVLEIKMIVDFVDALRIAKEEGKRIQFLRWGSIYEWRGGKLYLLSQEQRIEACGSLDVYLGSKWKILEP